MKTAEYLDRLLLKYSNTFNIYKPFRIGANQYPAYGYFFSHNEKYVLVQEANMWSMDSYEHVIFLETEEVTEAVLDQAEELIRDQMESKLVRKGEKYPPKNHMTSLLTVAIVSQTGPGEQLQKRIKRFHFDKGYLFHIRGYCRGRIMVASMEDEQVYTCGQGKDMKALYQKVFAEVKEGKEGFEEVCRRQGIEPFKQESYS